MIEKKIQQAMIQKKFWLTAAESCTGGLLSSRVTDQPGSSEYFLGGVVSYANQIKTQLLGVHPSTLEQYGAVSEQTVREMATGVRRAFANGDHPIDRIVAVAITGIAGPGGWTPDKPAGLVWIGVESAFGTACRSFWHAGGRMENKNQFVQWAFEMLVEHLGLTEGG